MLFFYPSMKLLSLKMPDALVEGMDELVRRGLYPSRSAVIRTAVRDLLRKELWSNVEG
jgi:Arc/MetJ-type ribon-helix-helix transcriptional regulator